jgi:hypothetical protein
MKPVKFNPLDPADAAYLELFWRILYERQLDEIDAYCFDLEAGGGLEAA